MGNLKLYGVCRACDEVMAAGTNCQHKSPLIAGDLLQSETASKQARSIRYRMTIAKLPVAKDIEQHGPTGTPKNEGPVKEPAAGNFASDQG